jgi:anti-sigma factor RsiW
MKEELQLKLQAHLDGELPEAEAREMTDLLARDAAAAELFAELTHTSAAMAGAEAEVKLPESREFYWSKIQRGIEREESAAVAESKSPASWFLSLRRLLFPAMGVAALLLAVNLMGPMGASGDAEMETAFADADTLTYRDYAGGTTLIWLPYPAENEFAENGSNDILN